MSGHEETTLDEYVNLADRLKDGSIPYWKWLTMETVDLLNLIDPPLDIDDDSVV